MAAMISVDVLDALVERGRELQQLLHQSPELMAFAEGLRQAKEPGSRNRKFLLSEVWKIPQREEADLGKKKEPEPAGPDTVDVLRG